VVRRLGDPAPSYRYASGPGDCCRPSRTGCGLPGGWMSVSRSRPQAVRATARRPSGREGSTLPVPPRYPGIGSTRSFPCGTAFGSGSGVLVRVVPAPSREPHGPTAVRTSWPFVLAQVSSILAPAAPTSPYFLVDPRPHPPARTLLPTSWLRGLHLAGHLVNTGRAWQRASLRPATGGARSVESTLLDRLAAPRRSATARRTPAPGPAAAVRDRRHPGLKSTQGRRASAGSHRPT